MISGNLLLCKFIERDHGFKCKHKNCYNGLVDKETESPYHFTDWKRAYNT